MWTLCVFDQLIGHYDDYSLHTFYTGRWLIYFRLSVNTARNMNTPGAHPTARCPEQLYFHHKHENSIRLGNQPSWMESTQFALDPKRDAQTKAIAWSTTKRSACEFVVIGFQVGTDPRSATASRHSIIKRGFVYLCGSTCPIAFLNRQRKSRNLLEHACGGSTGVNAILTFLAIVRLLHHLAKSQ